MMLIFIINAFNAKWHEKCQIASLNSLTLLTLKIIHVIFPL